MWWILDNLWPQWKRASEIQRVEEVDELCHGGTQTSQWSEVKWKRSKRLIWGEINFVNWSSHS